MNLTYRMAALEAMARKVIKGYDPSLLDGPPRAIPVERIAKHLGLDIEYQCLRKNGAILGEMVYDKTLVPVYFADLKKYDLITVKGGTIILDESLLNCRSDGRLNFTCAHEIAHWILHQDLYAGTGQAAAYGDPLMSSEENPVVESQANQLGSCLLMPTGQVKRAFYAGRGKPDIVEYLAELFAVSKQAMAIFLREHGLIY